MQPHLLLFTLNLVFSVPFITAGSALHKVLTKRNPQSEEYQGYRCGIKVISKGLVEQTVERATTLPRSFISFGHHDGLSVYPAPYNGPLLFGTTEPLWLVPLLDPNQQQFLGTESYYVILENTLSTVLGVIWQQGNAQERCIKEWDLSDTPGHGYVLGYRCPFAIYPFDMIFAALELEKNTLGDINSDKFYGSNTFDESIRLFERPILPGGKLQLGAPESVITDNNSNVIGMVYKRRKKYYRCRLTVKNYITPKFIGTASAPQPQSINIVEEGVDVFDCGNYDILSDQVVLGTVGSHQRFIENLETFSYRKYPNLYKSADETRSTNLYKWPFRINKLGHTYDSPFVGWERFYSIIDEFSDIHGVMVRDEDQNLVECVRKITDKGTYDAKLPNFLKGLTRKRKYNATASEILGSSRLYGVGRPFKKYQPD